MSWHAVDKIEESAKNTRELLLPFKKGLWAKLTFLTFLTGSGFSTGLFQMPMSMPAGSHHSMMNTTSLGYAPRIIWILLTAGIILGLAILFINSVAEFAVFKSLRSKEVKLGKYFSQNTGRGLRYMAYQIFFLIVLALMALIAVFGFVLNPVLGFASLLALLPLFLILAVLDTLVRDFVLLEMLESDKGFVKSAKTVWKDFRPQWKQIGVYLIVRSVLAAAIGVVIATIAGFGGLLFLLPGLALMFLLEVSMIFLIPLVALILVAVITLIAVTMPFNIYFYNYRIAVYDALKA